MLCFLGFLSSIFYLFLYCYKNLFAIFACFFYVFYYNIPCCVTKRILGKQSSENGFTKNAITTKKQTKQATQNVSKFLYCIEVFRYMEQMSRFAFAFWLSEIVSSLTRITPLPYVLGRDFCIVYELWLLVKKLEDIESML